MRFMLLGEQATGKSSLLVALYGALVNRRIEDLRIVRTIDDVEFLSRGLLAFGRQESLRRTEIDSDARLLVELARADQLVTLDIPDRSGELLKHMLDARVWDSGLLAQIRLAEGAMLFLRADQLIAEASPPPLPASADESSEPFAETVAVQAPPAPPWSPALMPADARAVDLLQSLLDQRSEPLPLAIIISAWDSVGDPGPSPRDWLAESVRLLDQYLESNAERLPHAVFGVSAQGGDFSSGLAGELIRADPWDRAYLVGPDGLRETLASPILWLLDAKT